MAVRPSYNPDEEHFQDLLEAFGANGQTDVRQASRVVWSRYQAVKRRHDDLGRVVRLIQGIRRCSRGEAIETFILEMHRYLYSGVLTNAGSYRSADEPGRGRVYFGGQKGAAMRPRYTGAPADRIARLMAGAYELLNDKDAPIESSARFYIEMSAVHPFYDANGRLGRLAVTSYLNLNDLYMNWDQVDDKHSTFIKRLNACLDRRTAVQGYEPYEARFISLWSDFTSSVDSFHNPSVAGPEDESVL